MMTPAYALTATERVLPRLALDFTTATLDPRVTVTRALNTATRINSSGLIETVNADLPRFDYDPTTLLCRGILIEETRANLLLHSSGANESAWTKDAAGTGVAPVVTPNFAVAPDGTTTADRIQFNRGAGTTVNDVSRLFQFVGGTDTRTATVYLKSNDSNTYSLQLLTGSNVQAISVTPNNFTRFSVSGATGSNFILRLVGSVGSSTTADILFWGSQLETGAFATSYIPTTTLSRTRNADAVSMTGTNFSDWYNATEGTIVALFYSYGSSVNNPRIFELSDNTTSNRIRCYMGATNTTTQISSGGSSVATLSNSLSSPYNAYNQISVGYKLDNFGAAANGNAIQTDPSGAVPVSPIQLNIGSDYLGASFSQLNGYIAKMRYYNQRLINNEVVAFSKQG